jgi:hypothetical protein
MEAGQYPDLGLITMRVYLVIQIATVIFLSATIGLSATVSSSANSNNSRIQHVILVMMENHGDQEIVGNKSAPYTNQLISQYAFASQYSAVGPDSVDLSNYLGITDGSTNITNWSSDCLPSSCWSDYTNIFSLLQNRGLTWKGYAESMPSNCYGNQSGTMPNTSPPAPWYVPRHNPILYLRDLTNFCSENDVPLGNITLKTGNFFQALDNNNLPNFSIIAPNMCDDMHTCPSGQDQIASGDKWLSNFIPNIISSASFSSTVIFITFDDAGASSTDYIPMIIVGPSTLVNYGQFAGQFNHYSTLATIEDIFGLGNLGRGDSTATAMKVIFPSLSSSSETSPSSSSTSSSTTTSSSSSSTTTSTTSSRETSISTDSSRTTSNVGNDTGPSISAGLLLGLIATAVGAAAFAVGLFVKRRR